MEKQFSAFSLMSFSFQNSNQNFEFTLWLISGDRKTCLSYHVSKCNAIVKPGFLLALNRSWTFHWYLLLPYHSLLTGPLWENKTERALFRGRDSREERLHLVKLSKENPELLDAGITGYFFFREKEKELGKAQLMGFFDFFKVAVKSQFWINFAVEFLSTEKTRLTFVNSFQ